MKLVNLLQARICHSQVLALDLVEYLKETTFRLHVYDCLDLFIP